MLQALKEVEDTRSDLVSTTEQSAHLTDALAASDKSLTLSTQLYKGAIEALFNVKVLNVRTQNRRGKPRRYRQKIGWMRRWKKAIVSLYEEHRIDFY